MKEIDEKFVRKCIDRVQKRVEEVILQVAKEVGIPVNKKPFTREEHIQRHKELHQALDELIADWFTNGKGTLDKSVHELLQVELQANNGPRTANNV